MVKQLSEHRRKTALYLEILNKAIDIGDDHLACIVRNKLRHHHHQEYAIATPTGGVIIRFPTNHRPAGRKSDMPYVTLPRESSKWLDWAIGLSVFPGSLLAMVTLVIIFS